MTDLLDGSVIRDRWLAYQAATIVAFVFLTFTSVRPIEIGAAVAATGIPTSVRDPSSFATCPPSRSSPDHRLAYSATYVDAAPG